MSARVSQLPIETLVLPENTETRVSQLPVEVLVKPITTKSRVTQLPVEVMYTLAVVGNVRVSQYPVEVMLGFTQITRRKKYGPSVQCV